VSDAVLWHDLECGSYREDLALWRELARGPVLDVGAGTGRVALDLARAGHEVVALDTDPELLAALRDRAGGLQVLTVTGDARDFALDRRFGTVLVPMQTAQLLGGPEARAGLLRCAREHLTPGGLLAVALADALEAFSAEDDLLPVPDMREVDGVVYASRPTAVVDEGARVAIHRLRETVMPDGRREVADDVVRLDRVDAAQLEAEGAAAGLRALPARRIPETDDYVGSVVVLLEAP
jgi:SAM-dependent methyltransferase